MEAISTFKKQRSVVKAALRRIFTFCSTQDDVDQIRSRVEKADELFKTFEQIQWQIEEHSPQESQQVEENYRASVEDCYHSIKARYYGLINTSTQEQQQRGTSTEENSEISRAVQVLVEHQGSMSTLMERFVNNMQPVNASTPNEPAATTHGEIRLPRVNLPEFSGNILEWVRFKELFETFVHNRTSLSEIEKLEYLNSKLKGDALSIVKHLRPTANNYTVAWELLNKKYNNNQNLKSAYMQLLFEQPAIKSSSLGEIQRFYNSINEGYNALKSLDETVEQWSSALLFNVEKKLDGNSAALWYRGKKKDEPSTFIQFLEFLEQRVFELENMQGKQQQLDTTSKDQQKRVQTRTYTTTTTTQVCPICSNDHPLYQCEKFIKMSVEQRREVVRSSNRCFNCLRGEHRATNCRSRACKKCNRNHNTLLHMPDVSNRNNIQQSATSAQQTAVSVQEEDIITTTAAVNNEVTRINSNTSQKKEQHRVLLPTAIVTVFGDQNAKFQCRALLDSGSQGTLISEACIHRVGLKRKFDKTVVFGLGNASGNQSKGKVTLKISTMTGNILETDAMCLPKLTKLIPAINIHNQKLEYFKNLKLADPDFHKEAEIDIILGADIFIECCRSEIIVHPSGSPSALNTSFGWVLMGRVQSESSSYICSNNANFDVQQCLQRFWEIEEVPTTTQRSPEEEEAEKHYEKTTVRLENGRYEVKLPFKNNKVNIGESKAIAFKRLQAMERKFKQNKQIEEDYKKFMQEYISLGHMQIVDKSCQFKNFLPHHAVLKLNSTTSRIRVVFDASCKTSNGLSLNDNLLVGPKTQRDLFDIITSFRMNKIAYVSDIEKMYRQVSMCKQDRLMQCILWRNNDDEEAKEYTLNTVTYGTAAASFLATRSLMQVAVDNTELDISTSKAIKENFYVDDFMHSSLNLRDAIKLKDELCNALSDAGFNLRKWASNSMEFLDTIPTQDRASSLDTHIQTTSSVSTLGLIWNTEGDYFKFTLTSYEDHKHITKRTVLSDIAKVFDPMGWLAPMVISMKIFMQKLWLRGINWDELLPSDLINEWNKIRANIKELPEVKIQRWFEHGFGDTLELHGFSDASEMAYAATVYLKVNSSHYKSCIHLVAAKTRVAPVKQVTLPRLELCAAHLLTKLMIKVRGSLGIENIEMHAWTDSTVVLSWLSDHPRRWKTFVANRTAHIIETLPPHKWHHIQSKCNPADLATRGISTNELINNHLWWHGPDQLQEDIKFEKIYKSFKSKHNLEERKNIVTNTVSIQEHSLIESFSNLNHLIRVTAWIQRFVHNCKNKHQKYTASITTAELRNAHNKIVKLSQMSTFAAEIKTLSSSKSLSDNHPLSSYAPFVDEAGVLRVGGRLCQANIPYDQKHPIIINRQHHLAKLIFKHYHILHCHAGNRLLHYVVQLKYFIPACSSIIKSTIYKCTICMRQRAAPYQQRMGDLPQCRIVPAPAFSKVGVDFAGPYQVRSWKGRGSKTYKVWISIFVCLTTKAIHIELVSELSTEAFIATFRRFVARRGKPLHVYSDNGTNFVGANHQIKRLYEFLQNHKNQDFIQNFFANQQINWHFIPPAAPNFGGLWEAGVKAIKYHLKRVLQEAHPTFEEMSTTLCQIEACLNSRPLCLKFENDVDPLTPAHFLLLRPMNSVPEEDTLSLKENRLTRWQYVQRLVRSFWRKWSLEYLNQLQQRHKWKHTSQNIALNDVVIIKEENTAPTQWLMGKVTEIHPGADGLVRVVTLKTKNGLLKRPINKICPLFK